MQKLFTLLTLVALVAIGCSKKTIVLPDHLARIVELERRADLNDQLDPMRDIAIAANTASITLLQQQLNALELELKQLIEEEQAARIAGDEALADSLASSIVLQSAINAFVQFQIASINTKANLALSRISTLKSRVDNLENDIQDLQTQVANIQSDVDNLQAEMLAVQAAVATNAAGLASLQAQLNFLSLSQMLVNFLLQGQIAAINSQITSINGQLASLSTSVNNNSVAINQLMADLVLLNVRMGAAETAIADLDAEVQALGLSLDATQTQLNQQGVQVYKCNSANSEERIFKINGKFYAVMNRFTMKTISVHTSGSPQIYTTPSLCDGTGNNGLHLPPCKNNATLIPGQTITVPSFSSQSVQVVDSVKMALEILPVGSYITTDGSNPGCQFSITSSGSTNLVQVQ
jgi:peptidoglycan hydrolase CwlO-like protein